MSILRQGRLAQTTAIREGITLIRRVFAENDLSNGVTTAELFQLALRQPPPANFEGDPRLTGEPGGIKGITLPPHNDHPIRSKVFLKKTILPRLEQSEEIKKVQMTREITSPIPIIKKGKVKKRYTTESADASPLNPVTIKAWFWKPWSGEQEAEPRKPKKNVEKASDELSHLNKRRQRSREEKERNWKVWTS